MTAHVAIIHEKDEYLAVRQALDLLPRYPDQISHKTVVITPNWVTLKAPATGAITGPSALRAVVHWLKDFEPARLVVATGSGGAPTPEVMEKYGLQAVIQEECVEFVDLNHGPFLEVELDHPYPHRTKLNGLYGVTNFLVSLAQLKVHEEATVTLGIKNIALGWPPAEEHGFPKKDKGIHEDLHGFITAMMKIIRPDLTILSAIPAMVGTGPSEGKDVRANLVLAGDDFLATDVVGARLLGFKPQAVRYLYKLIREGLGDGDVDSIVYPGLSLTEAESIFSDAAYHKQIIMDKKG